MNLVRAGLVFGAGLLTLSVSASAQNAAKVFISAADMHCSSFTLGCSGSTTTPASVEMVNKFQNDCSAVKIVSAALESDYIVSLSSIQVNFIKNNQFSIVNHNGNVLAFHMGLAGSVHGNIKRACKIVTEDWKQKSGNARTGSSKQAETVPAASTAPLSVAPADKPCNSLWSDSSGRPICTRAVDNSGTVR